MAFLQSINIIIMHSGVIEPFIWEIPVYKEFPHVN